MAEQDPRFREVTLTVDTHDPAQVAALDGLLWTINRHQLDAPPTVIETAPVLDDSRFIDASIALFDSAVPGRNTLSLLAALSRSYSGEATFFGGKDYWRSRYGYNVSFDPSWETKDTLPQLSDTQKEQYLVQRLTTTHPPFTVIAASGETNQHGEPITTAHPGVITKSTLADFVTHRGYLRHTLHGSIGRVLDVLTHASDLPTSRAAAATEYPLLAYDELDTILRAELSSTTVRLIHGKITRSVERQLATGQATKEGEVVIDGAFELLNIDPLLTYESIARQSLHAIARQFGGKTTAATALLTQLAAT